ncbi:MAG TPA: enoyl-CoA hydratase-related protein [Pseudomonadales bacterium]|nr:enoyl-CoA hydratase-related protein [Pseudomonadales bacterium]
MSATQLLEEDRDGVRILTLDRAARKNALTDALGWALVRAVARAAADDDVRVIGITGSGGPGKGAAFCSGADLTRDRDAPDDSALSDQDRLLDDIGWIGRFLLAIRVDCDKPVVAGINGVAVGAGTALALCADLRIAAESAHLHPGYIRAGTSPDGGLSWTLPHLVGHEQAMRFLLDPRMVPASEALARGLVGEVVADDEFRARFEAECARLATLAPIGARQTKRLLVRAQLGADLEAHLRDELAYVGRGLGSEDGREAVKAIFEKRTPVFTGR